MECLRGDGCVEHRSWGYGENDESEEPEAGIGRTVEDAEEGNAEGEKMAWSAVAPFVEAAEHGGGREASLVDVQEAAGRCYVGGPVHVLSIVAKHAQ